MTSSLSLPVIRRLDSVSARLLGAGQAITGVSSVVKEGVENSLDGGARCIVIRLERFGLDLISVEDDGVGIPLLSRAEAAAMSSSGCSAKGAVQTGQTCLLESRCSSKTNGTEVISNSWVEPEAEGGSDPTLGFRGEALHALAQVSDVTIETMHESSQPYTCHCHYDPVEASKSSPGDRYRTRVTVRCNERTQPGTTLSVRQLFSLLPVRRRGVEKNRQTHLLQTVALVKQYAVSHPWLQLRLLHQASPPNGQTVTLVSLRGDTAFRSAASPAVWWNPDVLARGIADAYGGAALTKLRPVAWELHPGTSASHLGLEAPSTVHVRGLVWKLEAGGRATRDWQVWVVDGRLVDLPRWSRAVDSAYRSCLPHALQSRHVAFFLHVWSTATETASATAPPLRSAKAFGAGLRYDVNLSPDKRQVLMVNEQACADALHQTARQTFWSWSEGVQEMVSRSNELLDRGNTVRLSSVNPAEEDSRAVLNQGPSFTLSETDRGAELASMRVAHRMHTEKERIQKQRQEDAAAKLKRERASQNFTSYIWRGAEATPAPADAPERCDSVHSAPTAESWEEVEVTVTCDFAEGPHQTDAVWPHVEVPMWSLSSLWAEATRQNAFPWTDGERLSRKRVRDEERNADPLAQRPPQKRKKNTATRDAGAYLVSQDTSSLDQLFSKASFLEMQVHGQFNLGFIICSVPVATAATGSSDLASPPVLMVVDQHASDEKANYERLLSQYVPKSQPLVSPVVLSLDAEEVRLALEHQDVLQRLHGFKVGPVEQEDELEVESDTNDHEAPPKVNTVRVVHPTRLKVIAIPTLPYDVVHPTAISELLQHLQCYGSLTTLNTSTNSSPPALQLRAVWHSLATKACRSSIMIGTALRHAEMTRIVRRLSSLHHPWCCPHGRPTLRCLGPLSDWTREMPSYYLESSYTNTRQNLLEDPHQRGEEDVCIATAASSFEQFRFLFPLQSILTP